MRFTGGLAAVLCGTAIVIVSPLVAKALTASQVYSIAQEITVRIDGANTGSGIIVALACIACLIINESRLNCFNNKAYRRL
ncbi:MAG: hypothetical protein HEQ35_07075 [Gloeotrichia echinulata IR180]